MECALEAALHRLPRVPVVLGYATALTHLRFALAHGMPLGVG
ncbi:MAG TPA: hypothetical protein VIT20_07775 [Propionibacteriaceae bacterium]